MQHLKNSWSLCTEHAQVSMEVAPWIIHKYTVTATAAAYSLSLAGGVTCWQSGTGWVSLHAWTMHPCLYSTGAKWHEERRLWKTACNPQLHLQSTPPIYCQCHSPRFMPWLCLCEGCITLPLLRPPPPPLPPRWLPIIMFIWALPILPWPGPMLIIIMFSWPPPPLRCCCPPMAGTAEPIPPMPGDRSALPPRSALQDSVGSVGDSWARLGMKNLLYGAQSIP